jgi:hypothetical protein
MALGSVRSVTGPNPLDDEAQWRRPPAGAEQPAPPEPRVPPPPAYTGPPPTTAPPLGWRPPVVVQPPAPRALPEQDLDGLDDAEQQARTLTYGIGMIAGAIMLVLMLVLCGRALF